MWLTCEYAIWGRHIGKCWGRRMPDPYDWAARFEEEANQMMLGGEFKSLIDYKGLGRDAVLSIPTPDHYLPLLHVLATRQQGDVITFPIEGMDGGATSMLAVRLGSSDVGNGK